MELIKPAIGLVFWTLVVFLLLLVLLKKFAWTPILTAVKSREESINNALNSAEKAKEEMASLQSSNEQLLKDAYEQRDELLRTAKQSHDAIVAEAKGNAQAEADKIIAKAQAEIIAQKNAAVSEIKTQVASLSIEIAEKLLKQELSAESKQKELANTLVAELSLN
jgi:F-type H+-transporting ATPase subunit b